MFLGLRSILEREGKLALVRGAASEPVRALLDRPPLASEWVDGALMHGVLVAIASAEGLDGVQSISRRAVVESVAPVLRSYAGPILRLFGGSPHTIFSRLGEVMKLTNRGVEGGYRGIDDTAAFVSFCHPEAAPMHEAMFASWRGSIEATLDFCDVRGTVGEPVVNRAKNGAEFEVRWG
ncbi:MAG: hypothetical protein U0269_29905 [Polyangiales bacterium]